MRISTNTVYAQGVNSLNSQLSSLVKTQQQVATGRRILTPADDPVGSATAVELDRSKNTNQQYLDNIGNARNTLNLEESVVANINRVFQAARQTVVSAGNATLTPADRTTLANTLRSSYNELLSLANTHDGQGNYLFSGFSAGTKPFTQLAGPAVYAGDQGQRNLQITPSRQIAISDHGQALFGPGVTGNDPFATLENVITALQNGTITQVLTSATGAANTGTAILSTSTTANPATPTANVTLTYDQVNNVFTSASTDPAWNNLTLGPYASGQALTVNGVNIIISGVPANNDTFILSPGPLDIALSGLDNALNNSLRVQTNVGSRLAELDSTEVTDQGADLQYQTAISNLRDIDLTKAITDLTQRQTNLQAAQKSFLDIQGLSLFKLL